MTRALLSVVPLRIMCLAPAYVSDAATRTPNILGCLRVGAPEHRRTQTPKTQRNQRHPPICFRSAGTLRAGVGRWASRGRCAASGNAARVLAAQVMEKAERRGPAAGGRASSDGARRVTGLQHHRAGRSVSRRSPPGTRSVADHEPGQRRWGRCVADGAIRFAASCQCVGDHYSEQTRYFRCCR